MADKAKMAVATCERLINSATAQCTAAKAPAAAPASPDFDALAASLASQGNAISQQANYLTMWTIVLGIVAILATVAWGWLVKIWAEKAAREAVTEWMNRNAANEISAIVAGVVPTWMDGGNTPSPERRPLSQQEQEEGLGEDPAQDTP
jgi:hypothetical protein